MNYQLIKKVIISNDVPCPEFTFENPLLDKDVAEALSRSFVRILNLSQKNPQLRNLRLPVLENIRKMCQTQPENHLNVDENTASLVSDLYIQKLNDSKHNITNTTKKKLDAFLIRNLKEIDITSKYKPTLNPEIIQAFKNLNHTEIDQNILLEDVIHWDTTDNKNIHILKNLWTNDGSMTVDISVKLKFELEQILLEICHTILNGNANCEEIFTTNNKLQNMIKRSADSASCFQICCSILHYIFVNTNFNIQIQMFIKSFVEHIKHSCPQITYSVLYPPHLMIIVVLLDVQLELFNEIDIQHDYIKLAMTYLTKLHSESENDLIMLLSHFPQWHDIYFSNK